MNKQEAIDVLRNIGNEIDDFCHGGKHWSDKDKEEFEALDMAIEALSAEPIYCNECKHQDYCYQTVSYTKVRLGYSEHGAKPIEWCSRAERREP